MKLNYLIMQKMSIHGEIVDIFKKNEHFSAKTFMGCWKKTLCSAILHILWHYVSCSGKILAGQVLVKVEGLIIDVESVKLYQKIV